MSIFFHRNGDERMEILEDGPYLAFYGAENDRETATRVVVDKDAALRLHAALGEWLYPVHTPERANRSLIEQMIAKAVEDQVAAILPLHLSPLAGKNTCAHFRPCECGTADPDPNSVDPEPGDVGHPVEPEPEHDGCGCDHRPGVRQPSKYEDASGRTRLCGVCGKPWTDQHGEFEHPCTPQEPYEVEILRRTDASAAPTWDDKLWGTAGEPPQAASKPKPYCGGCLHSWARHGGEFGCNAVRTAESGRPYCGCKQVRP